MWLVPLDEFNAETKHQAPEPMNAKKQDAKTSLEFFAVLNCVLKTLASCPGEAALIVQFDQIGVDLLILGRRIRNKLPIPFSELAKGTVTIAQQGLFVITLAVPNNDIFFHLRSDVGNNSVSNTPRNCFTIDGGQAYMN